MTDTDEPAEIKRTPTCIDAAIREPHKPHAYSAPTGLGEMTVLWCEGFEAEPAPKPPSAFAMQMYLEGLKATEVRALADGMPYRRECTKNEIIRWLLTYHTAVVARAMSESRATS